ncbi:MAG TPA: autotransporter outer membrane beta-barrel domain-containing protein [Cellvibrionaceae bacterium]
MNNRVIGLGRNGAHLAAVFLAVAPSFAFAAQSLTQAINSQLQTVAEPCSNLLGNDNGGTVLTGGLEEICARSAPVGSQASTQGPSAGNTNNLASDARALLQNANGETGATQDLTGKWSLFANVERETLSHDATTLADAFDSDALRVNAGINYALNATSQLGAAVISKTHEGDYESGGDFSSDSIGLRLIAEFGFGKESFLQVLLGRDQTDTDRTRAASFTDTFQNAVVFSRSATPTSSFSYDENEAAIVLGTQCALGSTTITPSLGVNWQQIDFGTHSEAGASGLEVTTYDDTAKSLQGVLGLQASWAVSTGWGVWAPQIGASFINEFENKSRQVQVSFTGDTRAKRFSYDTEEGDSSYLALSAGSVFVLKNGLQFYVNAETYTAYENYSRTVVSGGLRLEL